MSQLQLLEIPKQPVMGNLARPEVHDYAVPTTFPAIGRAKSLVVDIETYDPSLSDQGPGVRRDGHIVGIGIRADNTFSDYFPIKHTYGPNCDPDKVFSWLKTELNNYRGNIIGTNLLYDLDYLQMQGIRPERAKFRDISWAEPLLDEYAISYNLNALAKKYLGKTKQTTLVDSLYGPKWINYTREVHPAHLRDYVFGDISLPAEILEKQMKELEAQDLTRVYDLECRLTPLLLYMRRNGVRVDLDAAERLREKLIRDIHEQSKEMQRIAGFEINFNAAASMSKAFEKFGIRVPLTEKGNASIKNEWLESLGWSDWDKRTIPNSGNEAALARAMVTAREYERLKNTFIEGYILGNHINGRVYAEFHPLRDTTSKKGKGTVSGRFSSSSPNLTNIPIHTALGAEMRAMFIPGEGKLWYSKDYSQLEYRLLAHFSIACKAPGYEKVLEQYRSNSDTDYHQMVADMTGLDRNKYAKTINFMLVFGGGRDKLAREIGEADKHGKATPRAIEIFDTYHEKAPYVKFMLDLASGVAEERGYVKTILGRRGRFQLWEPCWGKGFPLPEKDAVEKYGADIKRSKVYKALNRVIQGSGADVFKTAVVNAFESGLFYDGGPIGLSILVHDKVDGDVSPDKAGQEALAALTRIMQNAIPLEVPVKVDGGTGTDWSKAH